MSESSRKRPRIEMRVGVGEGVEYILGVLSIGVFGFERIALDNEQGFVVKRG